MERIIFIHYLRILESSGKQVTNYYDFLFRRPYLNVIFRNFFNGKGLSILTGTRCNYSNMAINVDDNSHHMLCYF
jgi:hypothetical protein